MKKAQGITTNKLIITWKDYGQNDFGTERESFRCTSAESAQKIIDKRTQGRIYFATWFDDKGNPTTFKINTKDTILFI